MNIQARKLSLIEEFLRINDEQIIVKLESFLKYEKARVLENELKPMSVNEFYELIDKSLDDSKNGRIISTNDLKEKIKTWE
jgi:hypothetical protein